MKNQALFSSKDKSKKSKCRLLQFLIGALRVKMSAMHNGGVPILIHRSQPLHKIVVQFQMKCVSLIRTLVV